MVGLAVLGLLSEVAGERPLICVIDDEQWLDQASAQTLTFAARRLAADPVGLVFAARELGPELSGLPELALEGLRERDARALLDSALAGPLDARVRDLIVAETRGNPLALLELPRGLTQAELAGGFGLPGAAPLTGQIEDSFRRQLEALPTPGGCWCWRQRIRPVTSRSCGGRRHGWASRCRRRSQPRRRGWRISGCRSSGSGIRWHGRRRTGRRRRWTGGTCTARWRRRPIRRLTRTGGPGTGRRPWPGRMRRSRRNSSGRRAGRRPVADWPRRRRSWNARCCSPSIQRAGVSGWWPRRRPACRLARSAGRWSCWLRLRPGRWMSSRGRGRTCRGGRSRSRRVWAAMLRRCCSRRLPGWSRWTWTWYREAIDRLGRTRLRPELARAHLLYGEWLRRENRRADAREQLRSAHYLLSDIGMDAFAERARRELAATGETVRKRTVQAAADASRELTSQEAQVARLARDGLSNPEIGARLFISSHTVQYHLSKVFAKLGISSRRELHTALVTLNETGTSS
jgi:DNA-binding CsgD family transcriptional regulator